MEDKDVIIKFLLDKVSELNQENKRLNDVVWKLHADCFYYQNHWQPIEEKKKGRKKKSDNNEPSDIDFMPF